MLKDDFKKVIEDLKVELEGKEISFTELDNFMETNKFYSVFDDGVTEDIKKDKNVCFTYVEDTCKQAKITFEIIFDSGEDEAIEAFTMKVLSVEEI